MDLDLNAIREEAKEAALQHAALIDFSDDHNLSAAGKIRVRNWATDYFMDGVEWVIDRLYSDHE